MKIAFNAIGFQLGWWLSVVGVMIDLPLLGPLYMVIFLGVHYSLFASNREMLLILIAGAGGTFVDGLYGRSGILRFESGYEHIWLAPLWITAMWTGFTATLNHALKWLKGRPVLGFVMGAIFGPLSYFSGEKLGVITVLWSWTSTSLILALVWGTAILALYQLNERLAVDAS